MPGWCDTGLPVDRRGTASLNKRNACDAANERNVIIAALHKLIDTTPLHPAKPIRRKPSPTRLQDFYEVVVALNEHKAAGHNSVWAKAELKKILPVHGEGMYWVSGPGGWRHGRVSMRKSTQ